MSDMWKTTNDDIIDALNVNGVDACSFFDEDEWDEFIELCMGELDHDAIHRSTIEGVTNGDKRNYALDEIQMQLQTNGRI